MSLEQEVLDRGSTEERIALLERAASETEEYWMKEIIRWVIGAFHAQCRRI